MRIDLAALLESISANAASGIRTLAAAAGATVAALTVVYVVWPGSPDVTVDAVVAAEPVFTPVALSPPVPAPAERPAARNTAPSTAFDDDLSLTSKVQSRLKRAGCYAGPVNGVWTPATSKAMAQFTFLVNARLPVDRPDPVLLVLLESHQTASCRPSREAPHVREEVASIDEAPPAAAPESRATLAPANAAADADLDEAGRHEPSASMGWEETAAATAAAAATAGASEQVAKPDRRRNVRKVRRGPSLSRQVSRSLRKLSRSLSKLF